MPGESASLPSLLANCDSITLNFFFFSSSFKPHKNYPERRNAECSSAADGRRSSWQQEPGSPLRGLAGDLLALVLPLLGEAACGTARSQRINTGKRGEKSPPLLARGRRSTRTATGSKVYRGFNFTFPQPMAAAADRTAGGSAALRSLTPYGPERRSTSKRATRGAPRQPPAGRASLSVRR